MVKETFICGLNNGLIKNDEIFSQNFNILSHMSHMVYDFITHNFSKQKLTKNWIFYFIFAGNSFHYFSTSMLRIEKDREKFFEISEIFCSCAQSQKSN